MGASIAGYRYKKIAFFAICDKYFALYRKLYKIGP